MAQNIRLFRDINERIHLLMVHLPYHERDQVLSIAYDNLKGGLRLGDLELRRQDENLLNVFGAKRLPDPTTEGDLTRRFTPGDTLQFQEAINASRQRIWSVQPEGFLDEVFIDVDGRSPGRWASAKRAWASRTRGSGVMRRSS